MASVGKKKSGYAICNRDQDGRPIETVALRIDRYTEGGWGKDGWMEGGNEEGKEVG
jgi:hypothetical protein